jgi:cytoskeletal protein RodZ
MIVTFGLFLSGRSKGPNNSATITTSPSSPSLTPSKIPDSPSPTLPTSPAPTLASPPAISSSSPPEPPASPAPPPQPIAINQSATIIDPPSNVRAQPNGEILCSLTEQTQVQLSRQQGDWYQTDVCGPIGFIHRTQVKLSTSGVQDGGVAQIVDPPSNVRRQPNGTVLCQIPTTTMIRISNRQGDWYQTDACGEQGYIHKSQLKF